MEIIYKLYLCIWGEIMYLNLFEVTTLLKSSGINTAAKKLKIKKTEIYNFLKSNGLKYVDGEVKPILEEINTKDIQNDNKTINRSKSIIQKDNKDIDFDKLRELIELLDPIKKIIQKDNQSDTDLNKLNPPSIGSVKQKLFKIDEDILKRWEDFIQNHKEYKVQSLISLALLEFLEKYDNN